MLGVLDGVGAALSVAVRAGAPVATVGRSDYERGERAGGAPGQITSGAALLPSGSIPGRRSTRALLREYKNLPWARAIIGKIGADIGGTAWEMFAIKPQGESKFVRPHRSLQRGDLATRERIYREYRGRGELQQIEAHPFLDLLDTPNPEMPDGPVARELLAEWMDISGAGHWLMEPGRNVPFVHAWPIAPQWINRYPERGFPFFNVTLPSGEQFDVPRELVWSFVVPDPDDPYGLRGAGILASLTDELETDEAASKHAKGVFTNRARPDILVSIEGGSEVEIRRFEQRWLGKLRGFARSFSPMFSSRKVEVHEISQNFQQLEFGKLRDQERDIIRNVIGMPPELLGILENSNRSTIDAADYLYGSKLLVPRLDRIRSVLQRMAEQYDERIIIDYCSPVAEDKEFALKVAQAAPWSRKVDEWRALGGFEEELDAEGGQVFMIPFTLAAQRSPADALVETQRPPASPAPLPGDPQPADQGDPSSDGSTATNAIRSLSRAVDPRVAALYRTTDPMAASFGVSYSDTVEEWQDAVDEAALTNAITAGATEAAVDLCDPEGLSVRLWGPTYGSRSPFGADDGELLRLLGNALQAGGDLAAEQLVAAGITIAFDVANTYSVAWAQAHAAELVAQVSATQRAVIREVIQQGIADRVSPQELARTVRRIIGLTDRMAGAVSKYRRELIEQGVDLVQVEARTSQYATALLRQRGETIGRTEILGAANNGQRLLWEQAVREGLLGPTQEREWITAEDDRVEELCAGMDHKRAKIGEPFDTPSGKRDAPPLHPRCRCAVVLVV